MTAQRRMRGVAAVLLVFPLLSVWVVRSTAARDWLKYAFDRVSIADPQAMNALEVSLNYPAALAGDKDGVIYLSERLGHRIWRFEDGQLTSFAGTGRPGAAPDGVAANRGRIYYPEGLAAHPDGGLVFADSWNHRIRRIDSAGRIWTIAGSGIRGKQGEAGPALEAQFSRPFDVAVEPNGAVLIVDWGNHCVRRVDTVGMLRTFAGRCGFPGDSGDGGPAVDALLDEPYGIDIGPDGEVYIADSRNDRVRRVTPDGRIDTVAGIGITGFAGDGGPANQATLSSPQSILALDNGELIIDDEHNNRIRWVDGSGNLETVLGHAERGFLGDGGPATLALIDDPEDLWMDAAGGLFVTDGANGVLRYLDVSGNLITVAGQVPAEWRESPTVSLD